MTEDGGGYLTSGEGAVLRTLIWVDADGSRHALGQVDQWGLLGCLITVDRRAAIQHRLAKPAAAAFWANRGFLLSTVITWRHKIVELVKKIRPVALWRLGIVDLELRYLGGAAILGRGDAAPNVPGGMATGRSGEFR